MAFPQKPFVGPCVRFCAAHPNGGGRVAPAGHDRTQFEIRGRHVFLFAGRISRLVVAFQAGGAFPAAFVDCDDVIAAYFWYVDRRAGGRGSLFRPQDKKQGEYDKVVRFYERKDAGCRLY